jgi:Ser/Thr protein kinase RdoA (MazF antagonist)
MIGSRRSGQDGPGVPSLIDELTSLYDASRERVNRLGFDRWSCQVVHGDWHPGNLLFQGSRVAAVLDFDAVLLAPVVVDLANGLLQFSIVGGASCPADWPDHCDRDRLDQFLAGYCHTRPVNQEQRTALPDLMMETLIAEAVLPVAATGMFGHLSGTDFLVMIRRKARWLDKHRKILIKSFRDSSG